MDDSRLREQAARLIKNSDYRAVMDYLLNLRREQVLSADPTNLDTLRYVHLQYEAMLDLEAEVEYLSKGQT
jgi:hypothetical protein